MALTRVPTAENTAPSLNSRPRGQTSNSKDLAAPSRPQPGGEGWALRQPAISGLPLGVSEDLENLPRIILVSGDDSLMPELSRVLHPCPLEIRSVKSCQEAAYEVGRCGTADVIFTDSQLPDGDWKHVLQLSRGAAARSVVILASRFVDVRLYLDALEAGAFDYVVPPFNTVGLGYIIVNAAYACLKKRMNAHSS